jgi:predicted ATPase
VNLIICDNNGTQNLIPMTSLVTTNYVGKSTEISTNNLIYNITMSVQVPVGVTETLIQPQ